MKYLLLLLIVSCGKIKVETTPVKVETNLPKSIGFGPDFQKAADFCDERYGKDTTESEDCFKDYRTFLSPKIAFDLANLDSFCNGRYTAIDDVKSCEDDLLSIISNAAKK